MQQDIIGKRDLGVSRDYCDPISGQELRPANASANACPLPDSRPAACVRRWRLGLSSSG